MLDEERKVLEEIERWEESDRKTGIASVIVDILFAPVDRLVDVVIPDKLIEKAVKPVRALLRNFRNSSQRLVNPDEIIKKASDAELPVKTIEEFRGIPITYLDVLSESLFANNTLYSALQGAGLSVGGYSLALLDLYFLFLLNLKMIFQIGVCYGYVPEAIENKEFALRIFCIASSNRDEHKKELQKMNELIGSFVNGTFSHEMGILATEESMSWFVNRQMRKIVKKRLTRGVPVIGIALGSGFNYIYTKEVAIYAYMFYRKRFLKELLHREGCER